MFQYVYVLLCHLGNEKEFYIGSCKDLKNRYKEHINKEVKTTKKFSKINLVYYEACINRTDTLRRENQLKTGFGRGYLKRRLKEYLKDGSSAVERLFRPTTRAMRD